MAALFSRSPQINTAAKVIFANWLAALQLWLVLDGAPLILGYLLIDAVTAVIFFRMAKRRWFPVPLCFLHGVLIIYHAATMFDTDGLFWEKFILNRAFDIELAYVLGCALFRIAMENRRSSVQGPQ